MPIIILLAIVFLAPASQAEPIPQYQTPTYQTLSHTCSLGSDDCIQKELKSLTHTLNVQAIRKIDPIFWETSRQPQKLPRYHSKMSKPLSVPINQIRFMQESASGIFTDLKHDLIETARGLQSGRLKVNQLPTITIWQDDQGNLWTLDHRRVVSMIMSKRVQCVRVQWADEKTVLEKKREFTTTSKGKTIVLWMTNQVAMVVSHDASTSGQKC